MRIRTLPVLLVLAAASCNAPGQQGSDPDLAPGGSDDGGAPKPLPQSCESKTAQPLDQDRTLQVGGLDRVFHLHVPASYDPQKAMPLVLNFHGYTSNGQQQALYSGMIDKSDASGFIVAHPEGIGATPSWNAGGCCGEAVSTKVDDIGFTKAMLDAIEADLCVDPARIFVTGMSNGGFMSHRIACELADRIAAVAPVAGTNVTRTCTPARAISVMHFHGTGDMTVPYDGNAGQGFPTVHDSTTAWATRNGCTDMPRETFNKGDSSCMTQSACRDGVEVTLCTIQNGGHSWPGAFAVPSLGLTTKDLSATDAMWTFFQNHPLK